MYVTIVNFESFYVSKVTVSQFLWWCPKLKWEVPKVKYHQNVLFSTEMYLFLPVNCPKCCVSILKCILYHEVITFFPNSVGQCIVGYHLHHTCTSPYHCSL